MTVKYYTTRNDANHDNLHALVDDRIEFMAFPYQPYYARYKRYSAIVSRNFGKHGMDETWIIRIYQCYPNGESKFVLHQEIAEKDIAFEFAGRKLIELEENNNE